MQGGFRSNVYLTSLRKKSSTSKREGDSISESGR
jgi:hypothetical protein